MIGFLYIDVKNLFVHIFELDVLNVVFFNFLLNHDFQDFHQVLPDVIDDWFGRLAMFFQFDFQDSHFIRIDFHEVLDGIVGDVFLDFFQTDDEVFCVLELGLIIDVTEKGFKLCFFE